MACTPFPTSCIGTSGTQAPAYCNYRKEGQLGRQYLSNAFTPLPLTAEQEALEASFVQTGPGMSFEEKVLMGAVCTGVTYQSWKEAEENFSADLVLLYRFLVEIGELDIPAESQTDPLWKYPYIDGQTVENVILSHYDATPDFLRDNGLYHEERRAYKIGETNMEADCILTDYQYKGDLLVIGFELYQGYSRDYAGELTVLTDGRGGFRYQACGVEWLG